MGYSWSFGRVEGIQNKRERRKKSLKAGREGGGGVANKV